MHYFTIMYYNTRMSYQKKEKFAFGWQGGKFEFLAQFEWELASRSDAFPILHGWRESNPR